VRFKNLLIMITIQVKETSTQAKSFIEYAKTLPFVKIEEESPYDPKFVKKIKDAEKKGKYIEIDPNNLWESLGLK
jgi:hypothetical protein